MDDLSEKIQQLLSSPDAMNQIQSMMAAFGQSAPVAPPSDPEPAVPDLGLDMGALLKLAPLLGSLGKDDDGSNLLKALKPYMHDEQSKRLDDAIRMMQLMKLLPLLKGFGKGG